MAFLQVFDCDLLAQGTFVAVFSCFLEHFLRLVDIHSDGLDLVIEACLVRLKRGFVRALDGTFLAEVLLGGVGTFLLNCD